jgi:hypothetical protein
MYSQFTMPAVSKQEVNHLDTAQKLTKDALKLFDS